MISVCSWSSSLLQFRPFDILVSCNYVLCLRIMQFFSLFCESISTQFRPKQWLTVEHLTGSGLHEINFKGTSLARAPWDWATFIFSCTRRSLPNAREEEKLSTSLASMLSCCRAHGLVSETLSTMVQWTYFFADDQIHKSNLYSQLI